MCQIWRATIKNPEILRGLDDVPRNEAFKKFGPTSSHVQYLSKCSVSLGAKTVACHGSQTPYPDHTMLLKDPVKQKESIRRTDTLF